MVRVPRVCRGPQSAWEAWRAASRTWEALTVPVSEREAPPQGEPMAARGSDPRRGR